MFIQDLIYGLRNLRQRPGFTAVAVVVLALGIGTDTAIFSVVYSVLFRPLQFKDPDKLVMVYSDNRRSDVSYNSLSADDLADYRQQNQVFEDMAGVTVKWSFSLTGHGQAEQVFGNYVSASFFPVLGVTPVIGRTFLPEEDKVGGPPVALLSHGAWERRFPLCRS